MNHDVIRLMHMIDAAEEIIHFTSNSNREELDNDRKLSLAVVHLLEIIGEAANKLSPEFREKYNRVPWSAIVGMRNRLIHGYFDIDLDIVWKTVDSDIAPLLKEIKSILEYEESN